MVKQDKINKSFKALKIAGITGYSFTVLLLLAACTSTNEWQADDNDVLLSPRIQMGENTTRSVIIGTDADPGKNQINKVELFVTRNSDSHTVYTPNTNGLATFVLGKDNSWTSDPGVGLSSEKARIFAFYPPVNNESTDFFASTIDEKHKIKVSIPAEQTFDGTKDWACSATDYLYGSASGVAGKADPIIADNGNETGGIKPFSPEISMQHALSFLVFYLESKSGRDVDQTYDYVKEVRLSTTDDTDQLRVSGTSEGESTMQINDGTLALAKSKLLKFTATTTQGTETTAQLCGKASAPALVAYGLVAPLDASPSNLTLTVVLDKKDETTTNKRELSVTFSTPANTPKMWKKGNRYKYNLILTDRDIAVKSTAITGWGEGWSDGDDKGDDSLYPDGLKP